MKAPREIKRFVAKMRKLKGKRNGVVRWLFEGRTVQRKLIKNRRGPLAELCMNDPRLRAIYFAQTAPVGSSEALRTNEKENTDV